MLSGNVIFINSPNISKHYLQLLKNREILYPYYRSHAGRDKWIKQIIDEFNVSKDVASIWLEHPQIPVEKIYNTFTEEEIQYLGSLNPFSNRGAHTLPNCFFLKDNYPEISLKKSYYLNIRPSTQHIASKY